MGETNTEGTNTGGATTAGMDPAEAGAGRAGAVGEIAVTGGSGFLGSRLVRELLDRGHRLVLLSHAGSGNARERLTRFLLATGAGPAMVEALPRRVRVVEVDVGQPRLGLDERAFRDLAGNLDAVWHSAADTTLSGAADQLHRVNVEGTRHMLDLADAAPRRPALFHVSTAFVAGSRRARVIYEDDLDDTEGFENHYERSKHDAEVLVREWSAAHGRPAVVFRPSVLLTDLPPGPDLPPHTLDAVSRAIMTIVSMAAEVTLTPEELGGGSRPTVRLLGDPQARFNIMPVEEAAHDMARIAQRPQPAGVTTYHIVGDTEMTVPDIIDIIEGFFPAHLVAVPHAPPDPTRLERMVDLLPGFTSYLRHRHVFDDTRTRTVLGERQSDRRIDREYLFTALGVGELMDRGLAQAHPAAPTGAGIETLARVRAAREQLTAPGHRPPDRPSDRPADSPPDRPRGHQPDRARARTVGAS